MMARPSVIPAVKERLEAYLEKLEAVFQALPEDQRTATLPSTSDGKVNVRGVAQAINLKVSQEKYLYERMELSQLINLVAEGQGLLPIGSRLTQDAGDKALKERLVRHAQAGKAAEQAAVEAQAMQAELLDRLKDAVTEIETLKAENLRLRAQLDAVHAGIFIQVDL
ncbi:hypothetical protein [Massilia brevitalea]|uniref:hypothetical protein n=1 Tax=Massilia brevitalea TaxID=442526 RepID=UPI002738DB9F|nr:hypothetical protein [Massilia brevitalea]